MLSQLRTLEPGVVSISGFPSAFPHDDDLYPLNANRENFAETPHRQIWWMPHSFTDRLIHFAPDLNSWFLIRPTLTETPYPRTPRRDFEESNRSHNIHIDDARRYSASLYQRFRNASAANARWEDLADLAIQAVQSLIDAGARREALELFEKVIGPLKPSDEVMETQSVDMANRFIKLASIYEEFGRFSEAETLAKRAMGIHERVLGPDHPNTASTLNILASLYRILGQHDLAEPLYKRALKIRERVLGPDHPDTAASLNNLAYLYRILGQHDLAEPLYKRAWRSASECSVPITQTPPQASTTSPAITTILVSTTSPNLFTSAPWRSVSGCSVPITQTPPQASTTSPASTTILGNTTSPNPS